MNMEIQLLQEILDELKQINRIKITGCNDYSKKLEKLVAEYKDKFEKEDD